jgi:hypothetical protein
MEIIKYPDRESDGFSSDTPCRILGESNRGSSIREEVSANGDKSLEELYPEILIRRYY